MSNNFNTRWIIIGAIWISVVFLNYWNVNKMESMRKIKEEYEILLRDRQFWNQNAVNIKQVLKKHASLTQTIPSLKLGLFDFENDLKTGTFRLGFDKLELSSQPELARNGSVPVKIFFQGTFKQVLQWFDFIERDLPYAEARIISVNVDSITKQAQFEVSIDYHFTLSS